MLSIPLCYSTLLPNQQFIAPEEKLVFQGRMGEFGRGLGLSSWQSGQGLGGGKVQKPVEEMMSLRLKVQVQANC